MSGQDARQLAAEFGQVRRLRPDIEKPVWHNALRLPKGDKLTDTQWVEIADEYMRRMGFIEAHPRAYVLHDDADGQHIHIVASRISVAGKIYLGKNENLASTRHIGALEHDYGLTITKGPIYDAQTGKVQMPDARHGKKGEVEREVRTRQEFPRRRLQHLIDTALTNKLTAPQLAEQLANVGVTVRANLASTGRCNGFSFEIDGVVFKGSQLGKAYTWTGLQRRGMNYEPERDRQKLGQPRVAHTATAAPAVGAVYVLDGKQRWKAQILEHEYRQEISDALARQLAFVDTGWNDRLIVGLKNGGRVVDAGDRVLTLKASDAEVIAAITLAKSKGWSTVSLIGTEEFMSAAWLEASRNGLAVAGYEPSRSLRAQLEQEQQTMPIAGVPGGDATLTHDFTDRQADAADRRWEAALRNAQAVLSDMTKPGGFAPWQTQPHREALAKAVAALERNDTGEALAVMDRHEAEHRVTMHKLIKPVFAPLLPLCEAERLAHKEALERQHQADALRQQEAESKLAELEALLDRPGLTAAQEAALQGRLCFYTALLQGDDEAQTRERAANPNHALRPR